jgi:hypothetical protein
VPEKRRGEVAVPEKTREMMRGDDAVSRSCFHQAPVGATRVHRYLIGCMWTCQDEPAPKRRIMSTVAIPGQEDHPVAVPADNDHHHDHAAGQSGMRSSLRQGMRLSWRRDICWGTVRRTPWCDPLAACVQMAWRRRTGGRGAGSSGPSPTAARDPSGEDFHSTARPVWCFGCCVVVAGAEGVGGWCRPRRREEELVIEKRAEVSEVRDAETL